MAPIHKLSRSFVARQTRNGLYGDGNNLWLAITGDGSGKSWIFRYTDRTTKREHFMGLGPLNTINLDEARELAVANRKLLRDGKDPMTERDARQLDDKIERGLAKTVSQVADEYFEAKIAHKSPAYRSETARYLKRVRDTIGDVPIQKVNQSIILNKVGLADLWKHQNPSATKLHIHLDRMFRLAIACRYYKGDNPAGWQHLQHVLPTPNEVHKVEHHPSLSHKEVGRFMQALRSCDDRSLRKTGHSTIAFIVEFIVLTGVRGGEVRQASLNGRNSISKT